MSSFTSLIASMIAKSWDVIASYTLLPLYNLTTYKTEKLYPDGTHKKCEYCTYWRGFWVGVLFSGVIAYVN
jgi:capsule polysaccharide modification protein KpsS